MTLGVDLADWSMLAVGGLAVGLSKTAVSGAVMVAVVLFALVLPVRESTGTLLVLLLVGDLIAVWTYRHDAQWHLLARLVWPVVFGLAVGAVFLAWAPEAALRPVIGGIVVVMVAVQIVRRRGSPGRPPTPEPIERTERRRAGPIHPGVGGVYGSLAGFSTMVANAAGPVMTLYLLRARLDVVRFVGTLAWFFLAVNLAKLPVSIGLGLVQPGRLLLCLSLVPAVVLGAVAGRWIVLRIPREVFEWVVLGVAGVSGIYLIVS